MKFLPIFCLLSIFLFSCETPKPPPSVGKVQTDIRQRWDDFIKHWEAEEAQKCAAFYTENAKNIAPKAKITEGRDSIEAFYNFLFENNLQSTYQHTMIDLDVQGELAIEQGEFSVDWLSNDSTAWTYQARSLTQWVKTEEGNWLIDKFMFNNPPDE